LPTDKFGYKYCLTVVDAYNKKVDAEPLKDKTPKAVVKGLKNIYHREILLPPDTLQFDQGKEFKGEVQEYLKGEGIRVKYTLTNRHRQNALAEAKNKQIGKTILEYQNEKEMETGKRVKTWVNALPHLIKYLNENLPKRPKLSDEVITTKYSADLIPLHTKVRAVLDYSVNAYDGSKLDNKFRVGDARWNKEPRTVEKIILNPNMPPMYQLNGNNNGFDNRVAYTKNQLQIISEKEKKINSKKK
jgi:DNA mismatch repair ATPase MutS